MKTEDILIYGGLALLGYKLFIQKPATPLTNTAYAPGTFVPQTTAPTNILQQNAGAVNSLINTGGSLLQKLFPSSTPAPATPSPANSYTPSQSDLNAIFKPAPLTPAPGYPFSSTPTPSIFNTPSFNTPSFASDTTPAPPAYTSDTQYLMSLEEDMSA